MQAAKGERLSEVFRVDDPSITVKCGRRRGVQMQNRVNLSAGYQRGFPSNYPIGNGNQLV